MSSYARLPLGASLRAGMTVTYIVVVLVVLLVVVIEVLVFEVVIEVLIVEMDVEVLVSSGAKSRMTAPGRPS